MLNFRFSDKGLGLVLHNVLCNIFQEKYFSCYSQIYFTDQILLSDCLYFLRYWAIYVSKLFVNQAVTSKHLKLH